MESNIKKEISNSIVPKNGIMDKTFSFRGKEYFITSVSMVANISAYETSVKKRIMKLQRKEAIKRREESSTDIYLCRAEKSGPETYCIVIKDIDGMKMVHAGNLPSATAEFSRLYKEFSHYADNFTRR
ncbi:MAG: hypothetical protein QW814_03585 [Methanothrix sp.]